MVTLLRAAGVALVTALAGCAQDVPLVMTLGASEVAPGSAPPVWPSAPDLARYTYVGELTGEDNFEAADGGPRTRATEVLAFILGLGLDEEKPLVLQRPQSGITDASGRVYVTDVSHQAVFVFDPVEGRLDLWAFAAPGRRFVAPIGIVIAGDGTLLVTDAELGGVFRFDREGNPLGRFGASAALVRPTGITRDPARGYIYVADTRANDIKIFDEEGMLLGYVGGAGESPGELNSPTHITFAQGRLFVTDTMNSRVQVFDGDGKVTQVFGERGLYLGNLARPKGVSVDDDGHIYVVEGYYDHLLIFDRDGRFLLPIGGTGSGPGRFYLPAGVWTDERNRIYVADMFNGRVSIFQYLGTSS